MDINMNWYIVYIVYSTHMWRWLSRFNHTTYIFQQPLRVKEKKRSSININSSSSWPTTTNSITHFTSSSRFFSLCLHHYTTPLLLTLIVLLTSLGNRNLRESMIKCYKYPVTWPPPTLTNSTLTTNKYWVLLIFEALFSVSSLGVEWNESNDRNQSMNWKSILLNGR